MKRAMLVVLVALAGFLTGISAGGGGSCVEAAQQHVVECGGQRTDCPGLGSGRGRVAQAPEA